MDQGGQSAEESVTMDAEELEEGEKVGEDNEEEFDESKEVGEDDEDELEEGEIVNSDTDPGGEVHRGPGG